MINVESLNLSAVIDEYGASAPDYQTILSRLTDSFRAIYGEDIYVTPDSKDGQMLAVFAKAIYDANSSVLAAYASFSPTTAAGAGLSSNVKINGIRRHLHTKSSCDVVLTGRVGVTITNGAVKDSAGVVWDLPATTVIGLDGTVTTTAICRQAGEVPALSGDICEIATPMYGWFSVVNPTSATAGAPVETDAQLRRRQALSVALPSQSILEGLIGAIAGLDGVSRYRGYENDTNVTDKHGIPSHSVSLIIDGGDAQQIGNMLMLKKGSGVGTYGATSVKVKDRYGLDCEVSFFRPTIVPVYVRIKIKALLGYTSIVGEQLRCAVRDYINAIAIGNDVLITKLFLPANLACQINGHTYDIELLEIGKTMNGISGKNILMRFNDAAECVLDNIVLEVK